jgi:hypothetical protein
MEWGRPLEGGKKGVGGQPLSAYADGRGFFAQGPLPRAAARLRGGTRRSSMVASAGGTDRDLAAPQFRPVSQKLGRIQYYSILNIFKLEQYNIL